MGFLRAMHAPCFKPHFPNTVLVYEDALPVVISYGDRCVQYAGIDYYAADVSLLHHVVACFDNPSYVQRVVDALVRATEHPRHSLSVAGVALQAATDTAEKATGAVCTPWWCNKPLPVIVAPDDVIARIALGLEAEPREIDVAVYVCEVFNAVKNLLPEHEYHELAKKCGL